MAKLREELDSHHRTSEQLSAEQMREDDEREQQLLTLKMSAMKLQLELRKTKDKKKPRQDELGGSKENSREIRDNARKFKAVLCFHNGSECHCHSIRTYGTNHTLYSTIYTQTICACTPIHMDIHNFSREVQLFMSYQKMKTLQ